jgi:uncharacterized protein with von Willebrand factor type A (vWA) domain
MARIYCGDGEIPEGRIGGSLSQCMKKGVGVGLYGIAPKKYRLTEEQIAQEKEAQRLEREKKYKALGIPELHCGDGEAPPGKRVGTRFSCMKRGIGVGLNVIAPEKYNVNYLKQQKLTRQDVYMFARKLNIPVRDGAGNVRDMDRVINDISRNGLRYMESE